MKNIELIRIVVAKIVAIVFPKYFTFYIKTKDDRYRCVNCGAFMTKYYCKNCDKEVFNEKLFRKN